MAKPSPNEKDWSYEDEKFEIGEWHLFGAEPDRKGARTKKNSSIDEL